MRIVRDLFIATIVWLGFIVSIQAQDFFAPNPWNITENFMVNSGDSMYVPFGTEVNLSDGVKLSIALGGEVFIESDVKVSAGKNASVEVYGNLIAQGTDIEPIVFTSSLAVQEKSSWNGIYAYAGAMVSMTNCRVLYSHYGVRSYNTSNTGINLDIRYSHFEQNKYALYLHETIASTGSSPVIQYNSFIENDFHLYTLNFTEAVTSVIDARFNWWGSNNVNEIAAKIYDRKDDEQALLVDYSQLRASISTSDILTNTQMGQLVEEFPGEPINLSGNLELVGDMVISGDQQVFLSSGSHLHIHAGVNLTIEAGSFLMLESGAIVTFDENEGIELYGDLHASGMEGNKVVFTSALDNPVKGSWNGIAVHAGSSVVIDHSQIKYASAGVNNQDTRTGAADIRIGNTLFEQNEVAVSLYEYADVDISAVINYSAFIDNSYNLYTISEYSQSTSVIDARFNWWNSTDSTEISAKIVDQHDNGRGLQVNYSQLRASAASNDILTNTQMGPLVEEFPGEPISLSGNLELVGDTVISGDQQVFLSSGSSLHIHAGVNLTIEAGSFLMLESGASVTFDENAGIELYGDLHASGMEGNEVVFTSALDNPVKGSWDGIMAHAGSSVSLNNSQIKYASIGVSNQDTRSGAANINIGNTLFEQNEVAVYLYEYAGVDLSADINYSAFIDNTHDIYTETEVAQSTTIIDARYNWWGSVDTRDISSKIVDQQDSDNALLVDYSQLRASIANSDVLTNTLAVNWPDDLLQGYEYWLSGNYSLIGDITIDEGEIVHLDFGSELHINANINLTLAAGGVLFIEQGVRITLDSGSSIQGQGECIIMADVEIISADELVNVIDSCQ